jgi:hypothetical protein
LIGIEVRASKMFFDSASAQAQAAAAARIRYLGWRDAQQTMHGSK